MKSNYTHVSVLIDRSTSMSSNIKATLDGFREFLDEQKKVPGEMTVSLATFASDYSLIYDMTPIQNVKPLDAETYKTSGMTALLDSLAKLVITTGKDLKNLDESNRPEKVLILVITDGEENMSREFSGPKLKELIDQQVNTYNWSFMYIGANHDSFAVGKTLNMNATNTTGDYKGISGAYKASSIKLASFRSAVGASTGNSFSVTQDDIDEANK